MIIKKSIFRFVPYKARNAFNVHIRVKLGGESLLSPLMAGKALDAYWQRSWKTNAIAKLCKSAEGMFIDIGANLGQTLFDHYLAKTKTKYIGFEPNPHCVHYLNEIIEANSLSQYTILPIGLGSETTITPLYTRKGHPEDSAASLIADLRPNWELASQYISCHKFDDVCQTLGLKSISLMKIDVEGFELEVLKGMQATLKNLKPIILCEVLFADEFADLSVSELRNKNIMELLSNLDYKVLQLIQSKDELRTLDIRRIESFSNETLTENNRHLFDYVFVPSADEERVIKIFLDTEA